jgi:D-alanyl-D-alanine carboxypeptidase/D-alanyl-D-alanine-endopeptidase (penicillin-binding protein 4)
LGAYDYQQNKFVVKSVPETDYVEITQNITREDSKNSHFDVDRDWINRTNKFLINGNFSKNDLTERSYFVKKFNVFKPENYFLTLFKESLDRNGIKFTGDLKIKSHDEFVKPIYTFSRSYDTVIVNLNKTSDNLSTEMTLRALAEKYFGKPASAINGLKMIDSLIILCGLNPKDYRLVDGSGVSHYNLVSAELLLSVLKHFYYNEPNLFKKLYESFPIAGVDGSLIGRMKNTLAENNLHAKTGTLSGVSSLSGYVKNKIGNRIAFSILIQNYVGSSKQARDFIDAVCEIIAESK